MHRRRVTRGTSNTPNRSAIVICAASLEDVIETEITGDAAGEGPSTKDKQDTKKDVSETLAETGTVTVTPRVASSDLMIFSLEV